ncbi:MAG: 50S ribosomal protein L32 [Chloroflexi bacterium]|nr:50S ribosomal protein L32 [Chloroflexota bacterium]MBI5956432.1 50S ribosomal protein L32 [Chloroflexota bacterium]
MGALPKRKLSKARQGERRSHLHLDPVVLVECPQCHKPKMPHEVCPNCGTYNGREVIKIKSPKEKKKPQG